MKPRVYVDTSVFGGVFDVEFKEHSEVFFSQVADNTFSVCISQITLDELKSAPTEVRTFFDSIAIAELLPATPDSRDLARAYLETKALPSKSENDALHVAIASVAKVDFIVSWNFKHLVNINRIRLFNSLNLSRGFALIDIRTPREVIL